MTARAILHLDMDAFFASVEQLGDPRLRGRPVFVCGNRHSRTVVATASYEARVFGVKTGMPLHEARALCPQAILVEGNPAKYADLFRRVAGLMERYSPLLEVTSIDEAFLDVTGTAERFGGPLEVARRLQDEVWTQLELTCSIGLGPNKLLAKLASGCKKPRGITQILPAHVPAVLAQLPIEALCGIGSAFKEALNARGVVTCGELSQVAPERLARWFGPCAGRALARMARGLDESPVVPSWEAPEAKSMGHAHTLPHDTRDLGEVRTVLRDLSEKVGRRLRAQDASGRTVTLTIRARDFTTWSRARTLDRFLDDGEEIYAVGCAILARLGMTQPVRLVGISVSTLAYGWHQAWWVPAVERRRRLVRACDGINDRFGEGTLAPAIQRLSSRSGRHYPVRHPLAV